MSVTETQAPDAKTAPAAKAPLIEVREVVAGYGGVPILNGVDISITAKDIGVIVGPNGAGKSTTLKAIFGLLKVTAGAVLFEGKDVTNSLPDRLVPLGLSFVPQEKNVFTSMSVRRKSGDGRVHPARRHLGLAALMSMTCFPRSRKSGISRRANSRAGSARWWPWEGR